MLKFLVTFLFLLFFAFIFPPARAYAATCNWTGSVDNKWSTNGNWSGCSTPTAGDTLTFDSGASNTTMNNDISGLDNNPIFFFGGTYTLNGNNLSDVVGLANSSDQTVTINLILFGGPTNVVEYGPGSLILNGNNTYSGLNTVLGGALFINNSQPNSGVLVDGNSASINGTGSSCCVVLQNGGKILPGNNGTGIYNINGNFTIDPTGGEAVIELNGQTVGSGYDQINVANHVTLNNGTLTLVNNFTPVVGSQFTIINSVEGGPITGTFAGYPEGSVISSNGSTFRISYVGGDGNDVVLTTLSSTPNTNGSISGGRGGVSSGGGPSFCSPLSILDTPDLFQIDYTDTTALLSINPKSGNTTNFQITYGFAASEQRYGAIFKYSNTLGVQQFKITALSPDTTYYFNVKSVNGCSSTVLSNSLKIKTLPTGSTSPKTVYAH